MKLPGDYAEFERFNIELTTYRSEFGAILRSQGIDRLMGALQCERRQSCGTRLLNVPRF
jgi:hypothetical protein